ncbi:hypothetical protein HZC00_04960 [Candidatus Kaiserbacteria bacterium]|nr:hypothetical protein [Candidatus Kaiserbacteria bacterium]
MMDATHSGTGIWKHWKLITSGLSVLFVIAVGVDILLWFSLNKDRAGVQTLNEIIANQPPAPKTDEDKTALLDELAAAHKAAVAQVTAQGQAKSSTGTASPAPVPVQHTVPPPSNTSAGQTTPSSEDSAVQAKIKLLDSLQKSQQK